MNKEKEQANLNVNLGDLSSFEKTNFIGYETLESESKVLLIDENFIVLDKTPFYAEGGGQIGDTGKLFVNNEELEIVNTIKINNIFAHQYVGNTDLTAGTEVTVKVDSKRRWDIMRNHSATHFLHAALRKVLGNHVQQSGSYVGPDRLRFDFSHFQKLSDSEILEIENLVNEKLRENLPMTHHKSIPFEEAKKMGALMFFGDKYGDSVNVVQFGNYTMEFCGGTHVQNSSQIGLFKIISESSIASGVRRIEAVTGKGVEEFIKKQDEKIQKTEHRVNELLEEKKKLEKEIADLLLKEKLGGIDSIINSKETVNGIGLYKGKVEASNMDELKSMGDELRNKIKSGIGLMIAEVEDKVQMVCVVSDDLIKEKNLSAGKIVGDIAKILGGGGGGRSHLATAGGKDASKIDEALSSLSTIISKYL
jgi:alanyl-tRNA synthetase